jgi:ribonuclease HII
VKPTLIIERRFERLGFPDVAGVDEVGRGPLAGPVVACAVVLGDPRRLRAVRDSKELSRAERERLFPIILREARGVGVGVVSQALIDRLNIRRATMLAMARALRRLRAPVRLALIDGRDPLPGPIRTHAVIGGDRRCLSIAAASIVAKVTRDFIMQLYDRRYPGYGFGAHMGYPTPEHREAISRLGPCPLHRRSFRLPM